MSTTPEQDNNLKEAFRIIKRYFSKVINLSDGVDKRAVIEEISVRKAMSGANSWMLMCSIVIASIGLDIDSPVIIIGAMLISPLMSPILGIGLGVSINDRHMLKDSIVQFGIATAIAIVTSTIYFWISPFGELTEQIRLRTEPTFLDIPIAFFGGIAGIVSMARKDISTAMPGVAIATALMPPLCVVGYGLAAAEWSVAASSFYLFFLNTFFVSLATFLIVRLLDFPFKQFIDDAERKKNVRYVFIASILVVIPSLFIFFTVYNRFQNDLKLKEFVKEYVGEEQIYLDDYQVLVTDSTEQLVLKVYGDKINKDNIPFYQKGLQKLGLKDYEIRILSTADINLDRMKKLETRLGNVDEIQAQLNAVIEQQQETEAIQTEIDRLPAFMTQPSELTLKDKREIMAAFPDIASIELACSVSSDNQKTMLSNFAVVRWNVDEEDQPKSDSLKLSKYLQVKYGVEKFEILSPR